MSFWPGAAGMLYLGAKEVRGIREQVSKQWREHDSGQE